MNIFKFEVLDLESGDKVVKVNLPEIHVARSTGEYAVYTLKFDQDNKFLDFDVFVVTKGFGDTDVKINASMADLAEIWD